MDTASIVTQVVAHLDQHVRGLRGAMGQEPYRKDLFNLFVDAYVRGFMATSSRTRLTADGLRDAVVASWIQDGDPAEARKREVLEQLCRRWNEWVYAWNRFPRVAALPAVQEEAD